MENLKNIAQKGWPYLVAVLFFVVLSYAYFSPVLKGKALSQMDMNHAIGMSKEVTDFKEKTGEYTQWTNSMFGGMPTYQIHGGTSYNIYLQIQRFLRLGLPYTTVAIFFIYFFGFYLLMLSLKFSNLQSVFGGIAFGLATYNIMIVAVGHITKTYAIAYMPPVIAGVLMTYRGKLFWGGILTTFALGIEISTNHIQVMYYLALMIVVLVIVKFIYAIKEQEIKKFMVASGVLAGAAVLALLPNITNLATTYEYGKESIRGPSELSSKKVNDTGGTDRSYAYAWSYGVDETLNLLIPNAKGGSSQPIGTDDPDLFKNVDNRFKEYVAQYPAYHGDQTHTDGPVYMGAIIIFLFVLGLFIVEGYTKWWLLASAFLGIILSWGGNFQALTDFFIDNVPLYNKFRTLSMALVITGMAVALMAMLALKEIIEKPKILKEKRMYLYIAFGLTAGVCLFLYLFPSAYSDFLSSREIAGFDAQKAEQPESASQIALFIAGLEDVRLNMFKADAIRSFAFILLAAVLLIVYSYSDKLQKEHLVIGLAVLVLFDMWTVDKRVLNNEMFVKKRVVKNQFRKTDADNVILRDKDPNYRVLSFLHSPFNDGYTPYYHKSIGGYHGAKLRRYQEVIENHLGFELQTIARAYQNDTTNSIADVISRLNVVNMMNTKYIIYGPKEIEINLHAMGNAWFVDDYEIVEDADEEISKLNKFDPRKTAIIDKRFKSVIDKLPKPEFFALDTGIINLTSYKPNHLTYKSDTKRERLAVFSEIYYDKGWNAYIDGFPAEHIRVNYILRAMIVPEGVHTIEFKFEPKTYTISQKVSLGSSILVVLLLLGLIVKSWRDSTKTEEEKK